MTEKERTTAIATAGTRIERAECTRSGSSARRRPPRSRALCAPAARASARGAIANVRVERSPRQNRSRAGDQIAIPEQNELAKR